MRNIFLEKSYTKCGGKTIPRPFSKKFYTVCVYCMPSSGLSKCIETKLHITCFYLI